MRFMLACDVMATFRIEIKMLQILFLHVRFVCPMRMGHAVNGKHESTGIIVK